MVATQNTAKKMIQDKIFYNNDDICEINKEKKIQRQGVDLVYYSHNLEWRKD